jgi:uncharacterized protein with PQ loop repeat
MKIADLLGKLTDILNAVVPFVLGLTVLVILWGIFTYITKAGEEEKRAEAKNFILYGVLGLFIMVSLWGFVGILVNTFQIRATVQSTDIPKVPTIQ